MRASAFQTPEGAPALAQQPRAAAAAALDAAGCGMVPSWAALWAD